MLTFPKERENKNATSYERDLAILRERPFTYNHHLEVNGQHIDIALELKVFYPKEHKLERKNGTAYVDGAVPIGTDNSFEISREFARFDVLWNGKRVDIPRSLYSNLYNAELKPRSYALDEYGSVWTTANAEGTSILIEFFGSEAAGAYKAWLVIHRDGKCTRFISDAVH